MVAEDKPAWTPEQQRLAELAMRPGATCADLHNFGLAIGVPYQRSLFERPWR